MNASIKHINKLTMLTITCLLLASIMMPGITQPAYAQQPPSLPQLFWGSITIDGSNAPVGTQVTAKINDVQQGSYTVSTAGSYGNMLVQNGNEGDTVQFYINGSAVQTAIFHPGQRSRVDLSLAGGTAPSAPTLSSPANSATGVAATPNLQWSAASGATSYEAQVSTANNFSTTIFNQSGITATQATVSPALNASTTYYWRVNASNSSGTSDWSTAWSFTTTSGETPPPTQPPPPPPPGSMTINTSVLGGGGSFTLSSTGLLGTATTLGSPDGKVQLSLNANTTVTIQGQSLTVTATSTPPAPPSNVKLINAYDFGPNNTTFNPAITMTLKYDTASLPQGVTESNLYIAFWNGAAWTESPSTANTQNKIVSTQVSHFTIFALLGKTSQAPPPPSAPSFTVSKLKISPTAVKPGEQVTITATVTNIGGTKGDYKVVLQVNGINEAEKQVTLGAKETQQVNFTVSKEDADTYSVAIEDQSGSFAVSETAAPKGGFPLGTTGIIALALGGVLVIVLAIVLTRKRPSR